MKATCTLLDKLLINGWAITLQWFPSHCDILGNKCANRPADPCPCPYSTDKRFTLGNFLNHVDLCWASRRKLLSIDFSCVPVCRRKKMHLSLNNELSSWQHVGIYPQ
ncbi:hypothetical protein CDAR_243361 [Caerostris darwini]|uniref:RNase H type-1 domain-containing protein n=1 Tax=Caerostris darwini TaxID=1538125 RepID=A0AAV4MMR5_9ARAC|nr:hypothetical protein CDAR_243361 [Caerostris darwini]